jgi:Skp family chaperone for outer membrane proteins
MCIGLFIQLAFSPFFLKRIGTLEKQQSNEELTEEEKEKREQKLYERTRPLVKQDWDKMFVIVVLSLFVIAFWLTFEQAGSSLNVFAEKNTDRLVPNVASAMITFQKQAKEGKEEEAEKLEQNTADAKKILHELLTIYIANFADIDTETMAEEDETTDAEELDQDVTEEDKELKKMLAIYTASLTDADTELAMNMQKIIDKTQRRIKEYETKAKQARIESEPHPVNLFFTESQDYIKEKTKAAKETAKIAEEEAANAEAVVIQMRELLDKVQQFSEANETNESNKTAEHFKKLLTEYQDTAEKANKWTVKAKEQTEIVRKENYVFPAAWYQSVNALGIVIFAPIFTLLWNFLYRRGIEPSTPVKFALGILLVSVSFLVMIPGAIQAKQTGGNAAAYWLLACYLFATWGELCLSPVGLSMVTKLAPARYASVFMGVWFLASATAYWLAGYCAAVFAAGEGISIFFGKEGGLADFFLLLALIPAVIGFLALAMAPMLKKKMHGIH